jgi:DNA-binding GntR family transcriptional regulator
MAMLDQLNVSLFRLQFRGYLKPRIASQSATDHERIARAVLEGDALRSERVMRAHVRKSAAIILALPDEMFDG